MHCDTTSYIEYKDVLEVYSALVPYGIVIFIFFTENKADVNKYDEIVYMEPYPFTLGEKIRAEMDQINNYVKMNSRIQFKIMFYRNVNQKSGVGDIIGIDQALQEAPNHIKANISDNSILNVIEYCVYKTPKDLIEIESLGKKIKDVINACQSNTSKYDETLRYIIEAQKEANSLNSKDVELLKTFMKR